jgi:hypothetical protein
MEELIQTQQSYPFVNWLMPFLPGVYRMLEVFGHRK